MAFRLSGKIHWGLWVLLVIFATPSHAQIPLPSGSKVYSYPSTVIPEFNADPSQAKPIGVGDVPFDRNLALRIGLDSFSAPVDIYVAVYAPAVFPDLFLFRPDGSLAQASLGLTPWKASTTGPLIEGLLGRIPLSILPSCDYAFYLLVAPAGTQAASLGANCYLWVTSVGNLRVLDVSEKAASLFGGDVEGAAAILMALGNDYTLKKVTKALMEGRLTQYGEILSTTVARETFASGENLPPFCAPETTLYGCRQKLLSPLVSLVEDLNENSSTEQSEFNKQFGRVVTAYILYLAKLGYSGGQITEAIIGTVRGGETKITFQSTEEFPFGGIATYPDELGGHIAVFVDPEGQPPNIVLSDLDLVQFGKDVPGTEGMTFPAYYKGIGKASIHYSNPNSGDIKCEKEKLVFLAKVGGIGIWENRVEVYSVGWPDYSPNNPPTCLDRTNLGRAARGEFTADGQFISSIHNQTPEESPTSIYRSLVEVYFNDERLWGAADSVDVRPVLGGSQVITKFWFYRLRRTTEAHYNAALPPPPPPPN